MRSDKLVVHMNTLVFNKHDNKHKKVNSHKNHIKQSSLNETIRTDLIMNIRY